MDTKEIAACMGKIIFVMMTPMIKMVIIIIFTMSMSMTWIDSIAVSVFVAILVKFGKY